MLQFTISDVELKPVEINIRPTEGVADIWMNKDIETKIITDEDTGEEKTIYSANQAYCLHAATKNIESDVKADFDRWFEIACSWQPGQEGAPTTEERIVELESTIDDLTECILEMSKEIYA